jgi:hypothetical protein
MGNFSDGDALPDPCPAADCDHQVYRYSNHNDFAHRNPDAYDHLYPFADCIKYANGEIYGYADPQRHASSRVNAD